ncbi:helix-turn-helix domain-containing protein [Enterobacteriaceae bacterium G50]|nr:helix-turn-helix domain-containing protein [Enterobacteriaceae bacterium G50]
MRYESIVSDMAAWIENNKYHNLKIEEITEKSGFSRRHLQRFFKQKTALSIGTYSRLRRLSGAAIALRITGHPVKDIAQWFGFDSAASFIAAFRRNFNVTPVTFRKQDEWPFENMIPRYDYLARVAKLDCRLVRCCIEKPIMSSVNLNEITQNILPGGIFSMLIKNVKYDETFTTNSEVMLSYSLCAQENQQGDKLDWISIALNENITNLSQIQSVIYAGLLPSLGITRLRAPDVVKLKANQAGEIIISEYRVPCLQHTTNL